MKAAVFLGEGKIEIKDISSPKVGPNDILIEVKASGICGTDIHIIKGTAHAQVPVVLGHEYAGEILHVGSKVTKFKPGDRITVDPNIYCDECDNCFQGKINLCSNLKALGVDIDGGFAELSLLPEGQAYKLPEHVSYEEGALTEPLACCVHAIELSPPSPGDKVVILGAGTIGLLMVQLVKLEGASEIIVSDPVASKRTLALKLGANYAIDPRKEPLPEKEAHLVIECAGLTQTFTQTFKVVKDGGNILLFGLVDADREVYIRPQEIVVRELKIQGSVLNPNTHGKALRLIAEGKVSVSPLITHRLSLEKINAAFDAWKQRDTIKVLITSK